MPSGRESANTRGAIPLGNTISKASCLILSTPTCLSITDFGAFVSIGTREGLLHISKISKEKVVNISDILHIGQIIKVKIIDIDDKNRFKLSMKDV